ncbi:alpha/beta fold hydrolase [Cochlodiniinecator piscidefendens]|uniref:alpha/beta fold hydrolase n=1 Tax=Cochlodiniinecator piscidefendens TaxID=2715756 RepID=UPI00140C10D0|nr:alpha/beta fold hydrolase [Cochlodiniinecator piscidefendens]
MPYLELKDVTLHYRDEGDPNGSPLVLCHALGTSLHIWDDVLPLLPEGLRVVRFDLRGHGQSTVPTPPYSMGALVRDAEQLLDALAIQNCMFVGLSIGGMIAQGLAIKRLDQIRVLVLSNTAAKIGHAPHWDALIDRVRTGGSEALVDSTMKGWFSAQSLKDGIGQPWRQQFLATSQEALIGCLHAVKGTDFYTPTSGLRLPTLGISALSDTTIPPDLSRETIDLIPGSRFELIRRAGHLPCVEQPEAFADLLSEFLKETGHI